MNFGVHIKNKNRQQFKIRTFILNCDSTKQIYTFPAQYACYESDKRTRFCKVVCRTEKGRSGVTRSVQIKYMRACVQKRCACVGRGCGGWGWGWEGGGGVGGDVVVLLNPLRNALKSF